MGRKEPIVKQKRTFASEFKLRVVEELLSGVSTHAQISRKYNLSADLIFHWKEGKFLKLFFDLNV
jgi:transposase-like protein